VTLRGVQTASLTLQQVGFTDHPESLQGSRSLARLSRAALDERPVWALHIQNLKDSFLRLCGTVPTNIFWDVAIAVSDYHNVKLLGLSSLNGEPKRAITPGFLIGRIL